MIPSGAAKWWVSGALVDPHDATVPVVDHGLTVGDGVFETTSVVRGEAFALTRHLRRLRRSLDALGLVCPVGDEQLREAIAQVLAASPDAGMIRITVTAGPGPLGSARGDADPTVIVASGPDRAWDDTTRVITVGWARNDKGALAGVKSTSYAENVVALRAATLRGATEAILPNTRGLLCEGTGTNVFCELDGRLITPTLASGCLAGVTREILLEVTGAEEVDVPITHLASTREAFLSSSTRNVMPVVAIDDRPLDPGPLTAAAAAAYTEVVAATTDP